MIKTSGFVESLAGKKQSIYINGAPYLSGADTAQNLMGHSPIKFWDRVRAGAVSGAEPWPPEAVRCRRKFC